MFIYACETWGINNVQSLETTYRFGLKRALSVRESTCNELVYIESGRSSLCARISKQQLSFWKKLGVYLEANPNHPLKSLIEQGERSNISYLEHYRNLERTYVSPEVCQKSIASSFTEELKIKIRQTAATDAESKLGVYFSVNPELSVPSNELKIMEVERIVVTRYRCGSHYLKIETGRWMHPIIPRDERFCECHTGVQTLHHCLFECPLLNDLRNEHNINNFNSVDTAMTSVDIFKFLIRMERILDISVSYPYA